MFTTPTQVNVSSVMSLAQMPPHFPSLLPLILLPIPGLMLLDYMLALHPSGQRTVAIQPTHATAPTPQHPHPSFLIELLGTRNFREICLSDSRFAYEKFAYVSKEIRGWANVRWCVGCPMCLP